MAKFTESDLKDLFQLFDVVYAGTHINGSPQRFFNKWLVRVRALHAVGILTHGIDADPHKTILNFTRSMIHHPYANVSVLRDVDRVSKLNRVEELGALHAMGMFRIMQDKMIRSRITVLEALAATNQWIANRDKGLELRRDKESIDKQRRALEHTRARMTRLIIQRDALNEQIEQIRIEIEETEKMLSEC